MTYLTSTLMRHLIVQGIRPEWRVSQRRHYRSIVHEAEFLHHQELPVPTH